MAQQHHTAKPLSALSQAYADAVFANLKGFGRPVVVEHLYSCMMRDHLPSEAGLVQAMFLCAVEDLAACGMVNVDGRTGRVFVWVAEPGGHNES